MTRKPEAHGTLPEDVLRAAEERFHRAFDSCPIGMALTEPRGRHVRVNRSLCAITGYTDRDLLALPDAAIVHPEDRREHRGDIEALLAGRLDLLTTELRYLHAHGHEIWVALTATVLRDAHGGPHHVLRQVQDVTERRRYEERIQHMADHDALTGLFNRRRFEDEVARHGAWVNRYGTEGAVLVIDLDGFKFVNDTLGHSAGDRLLMTVASVLRARLRESDVLARLGADEFAVLLPRAGEDEAATVAESLIEALRHEPTRVEGQRRAATASIGIALFEGAEQSGEEVLVNADLAMYDAKHEGRDRFALHRPSRGAPPGTKARMTWANYIEQALDEDRFVLYAQPILELRSREVTRHELLLRMISDDGDVIPPGAFLGIAEQFDLVQRIDRWVTRRAIALLAERERAGHPLSLQVNLSARSLADGALLQIIERELPEAGIGRGQLTFEITETAAIANIRLARRFAGALDELGCCFALDDFGAGFGSFYYLKHLPFDYLKIDGEFVAQCLSSRTDQLLIDAVVGIARGLGKQTIAEFTTDEGILSFLAERGVDYAQGHHIGRAVPIEDSLIPAALG